MGFTVFYTVLRYFTLFFGKFYGIYAFFSIFYSILRYFSGNFMYFTLFFSIFTVFYAIFRHQAREAEPVDYDMSKNDVRNLTKSTYKRIGNITDGKNTGETTYQNMGAQVPYSLE